MFKQIKPALHMAMCVVLLACKKDAKVVAPPPTEDPKSTWIIYNGEANWSGLISPSQGLPTGEFPISSLKSGYQLGYAAGGRVFGKYIYKLNSNAKKGIQRLEVNASGTVVESGFWKRLSAVMRKKENCL